MNKVTKEKKLSLQLKEYTWNEIRQEVVSCNQQLAQIIDKISPGKEFTLFRAVYPYGSHVLKNGTFYLPGSGESIPLDHPEISSTLKEKLGYNSPITPIMLGLKNSFEMFTEVNNRIIPYFFIKPGGFFGISKLLDEKIAQRKSYDQLGMWEITSGARNLFFLNKISEKVGHERLQKIFGFSIEKPNTFKEHWKIFRALYQSPNFEQTWEAEVLFFSKEWFEKLNDPAWQEFKLYFLEMNWRGYEFNRSQNIWDMIFTRLQAERLTKPDSYHTDIIRHLFSMALGAAPGFRPVIDDSHAPARRIQNIYSEIYGNKYLNTSMMQQGFFFLSQLSLPVYYSLQYQTAIALSPKSSQRASAISDIYQISMLLQKYISDMEKGNQPVESTPINNLLKYIKFHFYHPEPKNYPRIQSSGSILHSDPLFNRVTGGFSAEFPQNSQFFNGCIQITNNPNSQCQET